jgi:hypothetical protein
MLAFSGVASVTPLLLFVLQFTWIRPTAGSALKGDDMIPRRDIFELGKLNDIPFPTDSFPLRHYGRVYECTGCIIPYVYANVKSTSKRPCIYYCKHIQYFQASR